MKTETAEISISHPKINNNSNNEFKFPPDVFDPVKYPKIDNLVDQIIKDLKLNRRIAAVGRLLKEQNVILGIGNFVMCEALYLGEVHPDSKCKAIPYNKQVEIIQCCHRVLRECYFKGGLPLYHSSKYKPRIYGKVQSINCFTGKSVFVDEEKQTYYS